jgi:hypothetical protein
MKSRTRWILVGVILILLILGLWKSVDSRLHQAIQSNADTANAVAGSSGPNPSGGSTAQEKSRPGAIAFAAAHLTPILFCGKVIDQDGNPVADADVEYVGNNIPWGGAARQRMKTDAMGEFQITATGISLSVDVSKVSHRSLLRRSDVAPEEAAGDPSSSDSFNYATLFGPTVHKPDKVHPVTFGSVNLCL